MKIEVLGMSSQESFEKRIQYVAAAGKLSRFPGNVFEVLENTNDYEKNVKLIKRIIQMGHESITDHDYLVFAIQDVSPVIEQTIIEERLCSFTIKSRREVNFANAGYYVPTFRNEQGEVIENQEEIRRKYCAHMDFLFHSYQQLIELGIPKEDARFVLPYCYHSNVIMGVDAHVLKNMIIEYTKGVKSNICEIKEFGERLYDIVATNVPYYKDIIDRVEEHKTDVIRKKLDTIFEKPTYQVLEKPILLEASPHVDDSILIACLMRRYQLAYPKAKQLYEEKIKSDLTLCQKLMRMIYDGDQKELTQASFQIQIPVSLAVLTHLTRHRTHYPLIPDFVPVHDLLQYKTPNSIQNVCKQEFDAIYEKNAQVYQECRTMGIYEEDLIYFHLSGNTVNMVTNMDGKTLAWILRLRTCNKAQWEIREIANVIRQLVTEHAPIFGTILGPYCETRHICHEGKESCGKIKTLVKEKHD